MTEYSIDSYPKGPVTYLSYTLQNSNLHNYYPKLKYLIIGSFGPLGEGLGEEGGEVLRVKSVSLGVKLVMQMSLPRTPRHGDIP